MTTWYRTGTVAVENASTTVTGSLTAWLMAAKAGDAFVGPDAARYEITAVTSNTEIEIYPAYAGSTASGQSYAIERISTAWNSVSELSVTIAETAEAFQRGFAMVSTSSVEIGTGEKEFAVPAGLPILPGAMLLFASAANVDTHWILGRVTAYEATTITVEAVDWAGEGDTRADWNVNVSGLQGPQGEQGVQGIQGIQGETGPQGPAGPAGPTGSQGPTGTVSAAGDGTAGAPGIAFASDTNTGIYRPSADKIGIVTAGSERFCITSSGNVGIGTTSPSYKLSIVGDTLSVAGTGGENSGGTLRIGNGSGGALTIAGSQSTGNVTINNANNAGGDILFQTRTTDRFIIKSTGNVGIGLTSPAVKLDVDGPVCVKSYTVGTVPSAAAKAGQIIYVSNEAGGAVPAFSDGTNWRRVTDRAIIS